EVIERLNEVLGAATQRDSSVTRMASISRVCASAMTFLRSTRSFLAPEAVSLNTADDVVAGAPGERAQIPLLALATLIVGSDPAVDGNLSQLNPLGNELRKSRKYACFALRNSVSMSNKDKETGSGRTWVPMSSG